MSAFKLTGERDTENGVTALLTQFNVVRLSFLFFLSAVSLHNLFGSYMMYNTVTANYIILCSILYEIRQGT